MSNLKLCGIVVSDKMDKTLVVKKERIFKHIKYGKLVKRSTKYFVHDEKNEGKIGDFVYFKEVAPISKKKNWILCFIRSNGG